MYFFILLLIGCSSKTTYLPIENDAAEPDDDSVNGDPAKVYYCEEGETIYELALWFNEDEGVSHSLFASANHDLDGFDIIAVTINLVD